MATRIPTVNNAAGDHLLVVTWTGLLNGDDGSPVQFPEHTVRSVEVAGTLGAGGSCQIEGSNDGGTNYATLSNQAGSAIVVTAIPAVKQIIETAQRTRPHVTAGDGSTSFTVTMTLTRVSRGQIQ